MSSYELTDEAKEVSRSIKDRAVLSKRIRGIAINVAVAAGLLYAGGNTIVEEAKPVYEMNYFTPRIAGGLLLGASVIVTSAERRRAIQKIDDTFTAFTVERYGSDTKDREKEVVSLDDAIQVAGVRKNYKVCIKEDDEFVESDDIEFIETEDCTVRDRLKERERSNEEFVLPGLTTFLTGASSLSISSSFVAAMSPESSHAAIGTSLLFVGAAVAGASIEQFSIMDISQRAELYASAIENIDMETYISGQ